MNRTSYHLNVVSTEKNIFIGEVDKIYLSGIEGELSILPNHAPLITIIKPGMIRIFPTNKKEKIIYLSGGILEIQSNRTIVLADTTIRGEDLDEIQAQKAKKEQEKNINKNFNKKNDYITSSIKLAEAIAKLRIIDLLKYNK